MAEGPKLEFPNVKSHVWEHRWYIYILAIFFSPMGYIVAVYLTTHTDKEFNEIGTNMLKQLTILPFFVLFVLWFIATG